MLYDLIPDKTELLFVYSKHFKKLCIGCNPTTDIQKLHLDACHVYFRALEYFNYLDRDTYIDEDDKDEIKSKLELLWLELKKSLYLINIQYYA